MTGTGFSHQWSCSKNSFVRFPVCIFSNGGRHLVIDSCASLQFEHCQVRLTLYSSFRHLKVWWWSGSGVDLDFMCVSVISTVHCVHETAKIKELENPENIGWAFRRANYSKNHRHHSSDWTIDIYRRTIRFDNCLIFFFHTLNEGYVKMNSCHTETQESRWWSSSIQEGIYQTLLHVSNPASRIRSED